MPSRKGQQCTNGSGKGLVLQREEIAPLHGVGVALDGC